MRQILVVALGVAGFGACVQPAVAELGETLDCVIEPRSVIELTSADEGMIREILVDRGDTITTGSVVVQLDDEIEQLQVELTAVRAESDVDERSQQTRRGLRRRELERAQELRTKNVASLVQLDEAEIEALLSELEVESAVIERRLALIEHKQAKARLSRRRLTSPVNGVVMSVEAAPGEFAHEQLTILRIAEVDPLHVEVFAPADLYGKVAVGQTYQVRPMNPIPGEFTARVSVVDPIFDAASGTFGVRLEIPNPDGNIPAGIRCRLYTDAF